MFQQTITPLCTSYAVYEKSSTNLKSHGRSRRAKERHSSCRFCRESVIRKPHEQTTNSAEMGNRKNKEVEEHCEGVNGGHKNVKGDGEQYEGHEEE